MTITAANLVRDIALLVDKIDPDAVADDAPRHPAARRDARPSCVRHDGALDADALATPGVLRSANQLVAHDAAVPRADVLGEPVCGMTWGWVGTRGTWDTAEAAESMAAMADHGVTWTALAYAAVQATPFSHRDPVREQPTVTDDEIVGAIREAHGLGTEGRA